jgi:hypothetical protein
MEPTVSLDLSDVLIILFASEINENVKNLSEECDVVWTERLTEDEKKVVIESTFNARSKSFGIERARLDEDGMRYLAPFRTDYIIRIIDSALKKAAYDKETVVTAKTLRTITEQQNFTRMRREFGYLGGFKREEY